MVSQVKSILFNCWFIFIKLISPVFSVLVSFVWLYSKNNNTFSASLEYTIFLLSMSIFLLWADKVCPFNYVGNKKFNFKYFLYFKFDILIVLPTMIILTVFSQIQIYIVSISYIFFWTYIPVLISRTLKIAIITSKKLYSQYRNQDCIKKE